MWLPANEPAWRLSHVLPSSPACCTPEGSHAEGGRGGGICQGKTAAVRAVRRLRLVDDS